MDPRRLGAQAGLITVPVYLATILLQDLLRTDFDPVRRFISELAVGPLGWIQIANFVVHGLLTIVFARGVRAESLARQARPVGADLLAAVGVAIILAGVFVTDSGNEASWHGAVHLLLALVVFSLFPATCFIFLRQFRERPQWRRMSKWTLATLVTTAAFWLAVVPGSFVEAVVTTVGPVIGVLQRVTVGMWSLWIFVFALTLRKQIQGDQTRIDRAGTFGS